MNSDRERIMKRISQALHQEGAGPSVPRPELPAYRASASPEAEIEQLLGEVRALGGETRRLAVGALSQALSETVATHGVRKACVAATGRLRVWDVAGQLERLGVELVAPTAGKHALAACDLGVTEADYALPETGTLGLLSSLEQPRSVSLLPRLHLAILTPHALRSDLRPLFSQAKRSPYLILITGPSRTADIELTPTIGVHGPMGLLVWMVAGASGDV